MSGIGLAMSAGTNQYAVGEHAKASGQAVVDVVYLIDFSTAKRPGAFSFSGGITVNSGMAVVEDYSKLNLVTPSGKVTSIVLRQPISVEGDFATRENVTKNAGMQKAMNIFGGLAAMRGMGGMKFGKSETYAFTAKSGNYETGAIKAATLTNTLLVDQLTALR
jgi:outer membrane protein assembly factor BamB